MLICYYLFLKAVSSMKDTACFIRMGKSFIPVDF